MKTAIKIFIFIYTSFLLISFSYGKNLILEEIYIESNFLNLIDFNKSVSLRPINLNKDLYNVNGNITFLSSKLFNLDLKCSLEIFYSININESTLNLINTLLRKDILPVGENCNILANIEGYSLLSLSFSKMIKLGYLSLSFKPKFIYGLDIQKGKLTGDFIRLDEESYKFNLHLDYLFYKNYILNKTTHKNGLGFGYSADIDINLEMSSTSSIQFNIKEYIWKNLLEKYFFFNPLCKL